MAFKNHNNDISTETGSTRFHRIGKTEFWFTARNSIVVILPDKSQVRPCLRGTTHVSFDNPHAIVPEDVRAYCLMVLRKQRSIREGLDWTMRPEEDDAAFFFHTE